MDITYQWQEVLSQSYAQLLGYISAHIPLILGALILVLIGWVAAFVLAKIAASVLSLLNKMWRRTRPSALGAGLGGLKDKHIHFVKRIVFWGVMLFFISAALSTLGLAFFADGLQTLLAYLPQLIVGILIIVGGYYLAGVIDLMLRSAFSAKKLGQINWLAYLVKWFVVFTFAVVGIDQLGINIQFVTTFLIVVAGVSLSGMALAFGIGSRGLVSNLLAARQVSQHLNQRDLIKVGNIEGRLVSISGTLLVLETEQGKVLLPARLCLEGEGGTSVIREASHQTGSAQ